MKRSLALLLVLLSTGCSTRSGWTPTIWKRSESYVEPYAASPQYVQPAPDPTTPLVVTPPREFNDRESLQQRQEQCPFLGCTVEGRWLVCTCVMTNVPPEKIVTVTPYGDLIIDVGRMKKE